MNPDPSQQTDQTAQSNQPNQKITADTNQSANSNQPADSAADSVNSDQSVGDTLSTVSTTSPATPATPTTTATISGKEKQPIVLESQIPGELSPANENLNITEKPSTKLESSRPAEQGVSAAEIEPNIEKLQQQVEKAKIKGPGKVVVRQDNQGQATPKTVAQPVVILPLSEAKMKQAKRKSPAYSIKWLYVWVKRQVRKLKDILVVYRETPYNRKWWKF